MVDQADVQGAVEAALQKGEYPDRKAAVAGMTKQLADLQRGSLRGKLEADPVNGAEQAREALWKALLERAGGDEDKAARLYMDELKMQSGQG